MSWTCWYCHERNKDEDEICQHGDCNGLRDTSAKRFEFHRTFPLEEQPFYISDVDRKLREHVES